MQSLIAAAVRDIVGADIGPDAPLAASGLDSLAAVELQGVLERCELIPFSPVSPTVSCTGHKAAHATSPSA